MYSEHFLFFIVLRKDRYYKDDNDGVSHYGNYDLDYYRETEDFSFSGDLALQGSQTIDYTTSKFKKNFGSNFNFTIYLLQTKVFGQPMLYLKKL